MKINGIGVGLRFFLFKERLGIVLSHLTHPDYSSRIYFLVINFSHANIAILKWNIFPMITSTPLLAQLGDPMEDSTPYRSIVRALHYVTITRPEIFIVLTKFVNSWNISWTFIGKQLNKYWDTWREQLIMIYYFTNPTIFVTGLSHVN